ncbi:MAG: helix-turn-helix transcriptional regulator [Eubacterium sp.]|nr:helix-turn-helix transcriptional regulator [Eubacterium sp.]
MRDMLNMTQRELSQKTGIAQGDISKIENGNANPSLETIDRLIKGMNGEIDFVIKNQS